MRLAVKSRKNILVSGPTGSGKTTWTKALIREIASDERLITIEDAEELVLDRHPNHVRLFYSKDDQGLARVTPKQLLESCLRMKPDRILLAELRAEEAFDYLRNVNSGHPGSITSIHAASCGARLRAAGAPRQAKPRRARSSPREDIKSLLYLLIDIVIQFGVERHERFIREIWFDPRAQAPRARPRAKRLRAPPAAKFAAASVVAVLLAQYLAGFFFLWSLRLDARQASPITVVRYAYWYGESQAVRWRLEICSVVALSLVLLSALAVLWPRREVAPRRCEICHPAGARSKPGCSMGKGSCWDAWAGSARLGASF